MRTEYTIKITDAKGRISTSVYPKTIAEEKVLTLKEFYTGKDTIVELFKVLYNGSSFYKAYKIM